MGWERVVQQDFESVFISYKAGDIITFSGEPEHMHVSLQGDTWFLIKRNYSNLGMVWILWKDVERFTKHKNNNIKKLKRRK